MRRKAPIIDKIEIVKRSKVRRAKLYFLRQLKGKKARLKARAFDLETLESESPVVPAEESLPTEQTDDTEAVEEKGEKKEQSPAKETQQEQESSEPTQEEEKKQ